MRSSRAVSRSRRRLAATAVLLLVAALMWVGPGHVEAAASCAGNPTMSPHAFTGVVLSTRSRGRVATVRTDAGATVKVLGTAAGRFSVTSADRTYEVGGRYEFHPINGSTPYEDNACTYTRLLSRGAAPSAPAPTPIDSPVLVVLLASAVVAAGVAGGLALVRRRRSHGHARQ